MKCEVCELVKKELKKMKSLKDIETCNGCNWMIIRERIRRITKMRVIRA